MSLPWPLPSRYSRGSHFRCCPPPELHYPLSSDSKERSFRTVKGGHIHFPNVRERPALSEPRPSGGFAREAHRGSAQTPPDKGQCTCWWRRLLLKPRPPPFPADN